MAFGCSQATLTPGVRDLLLENKLGIRPERAAMWYACALDTEGLYLQCNYRDH